MPRTLPLYTWCTWYWQGNKVTFPCCLHGFIPSAVAKHITKFSASIVLNLQTMSVLAVMRRLRSEFDSGTLRPYCFIEINGLKLASPENIYKVLLLYGLMIDKSALLDCSWLIILRTEL